MAKDILTLRLDGTPQHRGHVMARALVEKLDKFLKTFGGFERVYLSKKTRQTDFEVIKLSHNSPAEIGLNPTPRVPNYAPEPVVSWTLAQWDKISRGERPDDLIGDDLIADVAELSEQDPTGFSAFVLSYGERRITFDKEAEQNAKALRSVILAERRALPWMKGLSIGTLTGELRSVLDAQNERQIVIVPPVGASSVRCVFPESLRDKVRENLFQFVRVTGLLHYGAESPFPNLIELDDILPMSETSGPHFSEARGLFRDSTYLDQSADSW